MPKPSEMARQWHPYNFSDSVMEGAPVITKPILDLQLAEITTNRKETEFEEFARQLAQREVCSNLLPQTGPVGGGDSHTDSETVPVSPELALCRYWGNAAAVNGENWAFAFSAKKDFAVKIREDLAKIAALSRKFDQVFFITNQPVPDRRRRELEDELKHKHGFKEVRILDRTWIVEKVLQNDHIDLLRQALRLELPETTTKRAGPRDTANQQKLDKLLAKFAKPMEVYVTRYELASDYFRAGKLAARLEKPRTEVESYFDQAARVAREINHVTMMVEALYRKAWTAYWWYDDFVGAALMFDELLVHLPSVTDAETATLYANLYNCLRTGELTHQLDLPEGKSAAWDAAVRAKLEAIAADSSRPNNALHARTSLAFRRLAFAFGDKAEADRLFSELGECLLQGTGLGQYPFMAFVDNLRKMAEYCCENPAYLKLMDDLEPVIAARIGETDAAKASVDLGFKLLEKERYSEALARFCRAAVRCVKEETKDHLVRAIGGASMCYRGLGLLWAARGCILTVLHFAVREPADLARQRSFACQMFYQLASIELLLGRLGPFLAWFGMASLPALRIEPALAEESDDVDGLAVNLAAWMAVLDEESVEQLAETQVRMVSEGLQLPAAVLASRRGETAETSELIRDMVAALGHPMLKVVESFRKDPGARALPTRLTGETGSFWTMSTELFGTRFSIKCQNLADLVWLAEEMLSALECMAAFFRPERLAFIGPDFECTLVRQDSHRGAPEWDTDDFDPRPRLMCGPDLGEWLNANQGSPDSPVRDFVMRAILGTTMDPPDDILAEWEHLYKADATQLAFRLNFIRTTIRNLLGADRYGLSGK